MHFSNDASALHARWAEQYGPAFQAPRGLGKNTIILVDPKACAHFYAKETFVYVSTPFRRSIVGRIFGKGILFAEGESHKRQRRALNPAFTNSALRDLIHVFYESAYKATDEWDNTILNSISGETTLDIQQWANRISLDSIGVAALSHEFHALRGDRSAVLSILEGATSKDIGWLSKVVGLLAVFFPTMGYLPTRQNRLLSQLREETKQIGLSLLTKGTGGEGSQSGLSDTKSALNLLLKSEHVTSEAARHSRDEVIAQVNTLILAGYETTSISMTWSLVEMCKKPHIQERLRKELMDKFAMNDPTWDDLWYNLPYLDAVCLETLRLHPPFVETSRMAGEDDIIPLSRPLTTACGDKVTSISVTKGTYVTAAIGALNRDKSLWGPDADEFIPERWLHLEKSDLRAKEIQGHKHIMTFSDGPRICLGKNFALTEWKSALVAFLKNYTFELPGGPSTPIEIHTAFLDRPKIAGRTGAEMLMKVRKLDS